ncbi:TPA: hypothetical protein LA742_003542 [Clostridium botulinum]|uniref:rRNA adenine N-6-methyltransferase family protein n=1 Tax=Clostridium TaxID=1485 RepID=UPI000774A6EC|nr:MULTISPECIES: rRNA adenine N-6-methyltransferase family protein [Clostridium]APQ78869.1 adoMet dependent proline di-methyltransferase family protein [Clostridium botulinum]AUM93757.1 hypothetical protein RSJ11_00655 [Clostridium sporogenes]MBN3356081.1 hypothetical protein [Clostridium botulinum]HBJ2615034.1 hypothetical protein [Clostridium botulinum]
MYFENLSNILKEETKEDYAINKFTISKNNIRAMLEGIPQGEYVTLTYKGEVVMSNTPMEKRTNAYFVQHAHGDILIAGLGIGLIVLAIQNKKEVKSITVIEKSSDVIDLVAKQLPLNSKVKIINADIFKWKCEKNKYDVIYLDIWNYINSDVYEKEMKPLKERCKDYLKSKSESPSRFIKCWAEYEAKNNIRL